VASCVGGVASVPGGVFERVWVASVGPALQHSSVHSAGLTSWNSFNLLGKVPMAILMSAR